MVAYLLLLLLQGAEYNVAFLTESIVETATSLTPLSDLPQSLLRLVRRVDSGLVLSYK